MSDFFEAMTQKVLARCEFMRTAPDEYLFSLRALFAENPEIRETTGKSYDKTYEDAADRMLDPDGLEKDFLKRGGNGWLE